MNIDLIFEIARFSSLADQIKLYRSNPSIRSLYRDPMMWNLDEDFFLDAIRDDNIEDISFLIHKIPVTGSAYIRDEGGESLLSFIIRKGSPHDIATVLRYTRKMHTEDALHQAVERGDPQIVSIVAKSTSPASLYNRDIIAYAASINSPSPIIDILVQHKYSMYVADDTTGNTAMDYAIENHNLQMVKQLLDLGYDINTTDPGRYSHLEVAIRMQDMDLIQLLLEAGATLNIYELESSLPADNPAIVSSVLDILDRDDLGDLYQSLRSKGFDTSAAVVSQYLS